MISGDFQKATSVSQEVRDARYIEGKCVGCGIQIFQLKKIGWRRQRTRMIPLAIEGKINRGRCLSCVFDATTPHKLYTQKEEYMFNPTDIYLVDEDGLTEEEAKVCTETYQFEYVDTSEVNETLEKMSISDIFRDKEQQPPQDTKLFTDDDYTDDVLLASTETEHTIATRSLSEANEVLVFYEGDLNEKMQPHGCGEIIYFNGDRYKGQFVNGRLQGNGTMMFAKGLDYVGTWEEGLMHGKGTLRFPNGDVYSGEFQNGEQKGEGRMYFSDGDLYIGSWQGGKVHGFGTFHYYNGSKFEGKFDMGKRHGKGARQRPRGLLLKSTSMPTVEGWVMESISRLTGRKRGRVKTENGRIE